MHQPLIIQHLFQVSTLEDVSRERLESFVESYPSYGIGHYLLSCKLQAEGSERFLPETQRTCLYFSNPLWLQWLLQRSDASVAAPVETAFTETAHVEAASVEAAVIETAPEETPPVEAASVEVASVEVASVEAARIETTAIETPSEETHPVESPAVELAPVETPPVETPAEPHVENVVTMAEEAFGGPATGDDLAEALTTSGATSNGQGLSAAEQLLRSIEEAKELRDSLQKLQADGIAESAITGESLSAETEPIAEPVVASEPVAVVDEPVVAPEPVAESTAEPVAEVVEAPEPVAVVDEPVVENTPEAAVEAVAEPVAAPEPSGPREEPIRDQEAPFVLEEREEQPAAGEIVPAVETPVVAEVQAVAETSAVERTPVVAEMPAVAETPAAAETPVAAEASKQTVTAAQDFLFEPYHTIDYFASQGIKLTLEENPSDTLGKQLKSFTDWLKTMRRLPQKDREVVPDRAAEQAVQTIAAHSILGKDVVTETMADVLAKQGMREKARAVYEKLSLLNPDKRAYFAAKIEQLNIP
jgi:hypothetical protein